MRHVIALTLAMLLLVPAGCGGGGGGSGPGSTVPAAATAMDATLTSEVNSSMPRVGRFEGNMVGILNPGTPLAQNVVLTPDNSPGALPNSFTFNGPYDGNNDGFNETTLSGKVTFNSDPAVAWSGVTGEAVVDVVLPVFGNVFHANINFSITSAERRLSGSGTTTNPLTGNTTTTTVDAATPLVIKPATGAAGAVANACGLSLEGQMRFEVTGSSGTLKSNWNFSSNSTSVAMTDRTFTDSSGKTTVLPDTTVESRCGGSGTINDWTGTFDQEWACLPRESGRATLTISVTGPDTVTITDEDPPGSGQFSMYTATMIGGNPHALRGSFESGPVGFRYREDFNWTMRKSLSGFQQSSTYVYIEGPNIGTGGLCIASAPRR
jgi:hypothetical protein